MEGTIFREKREQIEKVHDKLDGLLKDKSLKDAEPIMEKAKELLSDLSNFDLSEIQERSASNLKIKEDHLETTIDKLTKK